MRIAYICQSYPPMISGGALVVQRQARGMASRGHKVLVISASDKGQAYINGDNSLRLVRMRSFRNPLRVNQKFVMRTQGEISAQLQKFRPHIIHFHDPFNLGLTGLQTAQSLGIPAVFTVHQLPWFVCAYLPGFPGLHRIVVDGFWSYANWLLYQFEKVITPTQTIADEVCAHGCPQPAVISNGVDLQRFTPIPSFKGERKTLYRKYGLDPELDIILHVGRLDKDKNVEAVIQASALAMETINAQLLVIGDGCQRKRLIQLSDDLGVRSRSHFTGFVSPDGDLPGLYRLGAVFTIASEIETQGLVILEALASGLPVVAVKATCIPELVKDCVNGYLTSSGDSQKMADRIVRTLKRPDCAIRMGQEGRTLVEREHAIGKSLEKHQQLYQSVMEGIK